MSQNLSVLMSPIIASVYTTELSVEDYLRQHAELSLVGNEIQLTEWDQTLVPARDLMSPVKIYPGQDNQRKRPITRERRQAGPSIHPGVVQII